MTSDIEKGWFGIDKISKDLGAQKFEPITRQNHGLMNENQIWIDQNIENGAVIFDRGSVGNNSGYYQMEQQHVEGYKKLHKVQIFHNKEQSIRIYIVR